MKWQTWSYLSDLAGIIQEYPEVLIWKARQLGITWLVSGICFGMAHFLPGAKILCLSKAEDEAWDFLDKSKYIWSQLPSFLRLPLVDDSKSTISWVNKSVMKALASTADAGRSTDATVVVRDECNFHPFASDNFVAVSPCIDSGGKLIDLSTVRKNMMDTHFVERATRIYQGAEKIVYPSGLELYKNPKTHAVLVFLGWKLRPTRLEGMSLDEWWESVVVPKYPDPMYREGEYPATIEEAMRPSKEGAFFDNKAIEDMLQLTKPDMPCDKIDSHNGLVKVWKPPITGRRYCIFTDPSAGVSDPHCVAVMDVRTLEVVAISHGKVPVDEVAKIHDELVRAYNNAYNSFEVNATVGGEFHKVIQDLKTPNIAPRRTPEGKVIKGHIGYYTTQPHKKNILWGLRTAVNKRMLTIYCASTLREFQTMILPVGGDPEVPGKGHDDRIMGIGGCYDISRYCPIGDMKVDSFTYNS